MLCDSLQLPSIREENENMRGRSVTPRRQDMMPSPSREIFRQTRPLTKTPKSLKTTKIASKEKRRLKKMGDNVKVAVRVRPFNDREKQRKAKLIIEMEGSTTIIKDPANMDAEGRKYTFDYSYWSHDGYKERDDGYLEPVDGRYADQAHVFKDLGRGVLSNAWQGFNCSLFAYGQTGSGKSYSMVGYGENKGIVPVTCEELFKGIEEKKLTDDQEKEAEYQVSVSMLEIYNETVKDLLNPSSFKKGGLKVREHPQKGFYVEQLRISPVRNYSDIEARISEGNFNRTVAATNMNATSSRAHTIVAINFAQKAKNDAGKSMTKTSIINLVDLAGSERADSTGATGDRLKEGSMINKSLLCLGNCIKALADKQLGKTTAVPYRDSTLTRLLKNALGGNSKTIMIAALSPADINYDETLSTLRFADRAKSIKTKAIVNESPTDKLIREMKEEIKRLQDQLKGGGTGGVVIQGIPQDEVEEMRRQMEEELKKNQQEMEDMKLTWQQRLKEQEEGSLKMLLEERNKQEARKTTPHFWNLNEDPMLTGMIVHFVPAGKHILGNSDPADIILKGLSVQREHANIVNKSNSVIKIQPKGTVLVNGKTITEETELRHNDRVMFGSTHLYVFHHPQDAAKQEKEGTNIEKVSFDSAQQEIAENKGFDMGTKGKSTEDLLLQEDLLRIMPMVNEANAMSEELDKKMKFELALLSPQARGLKDGKTEVLIKAKNLENGNEFLWDQNKFINRKYIMQEMYQNYSEGDDDWDYEKEKDPFWEPVDSKVMIGTAFLYLQSVAYCVEFDEMIPVTDMAAQEKCKLKVKAIPCDQKGIPLNDDTFVEDPKELLNTAFRFKISIDQCLGLPRKYAKVWCRYKFYFSDEWNTSEMADSDTLNPNISYEKMFTADPVTQVFIDDLQETPLLIQVWGRQKPGVLEPSLAKATTKELFKIDPEKLRYLSQDKQQTKTKAATAAQKKADKKDKKADKNAVKSKVTSNDKDKDVQIEQLKAEIERLKIAMSNNSSSNNIRVGDLGFADDSSDRKLRMLGSLVSEARNKNKPVVLTDRVDSVLRTGQDLSPNRIREAEVNAARGSGNESGKSKVCTIS
uniref:kinesin-like protein KIF28P n=1 Tax=Styela clava TaxID=7725 RepID=UPI00193AC142|nr:kinesin-like protein KIF28P [Styela clava]